MNNTGYVYDPVMARHKCIELDGADHPEQPERIHAIYKEMLNQNLIQKMFPIKSRYATEEEILLAHSQKYLNKLKSILTQKNEMKVAFRMLNEFNSVYSNKYTLECAFLAAGSTIELVKNICNGTIDNGVAIIRPPSHHAERDEAMGFCFFNNTSLGAITAKNLGNKVAIVDFDVHHNNGTVDILKNTDINLFSIHRHDNGKFYPGTGAVSNIKNVFNYPLNNVVAGDKEYLDIFNKYIIPKLNEDKPDIIMVSAGFDAGINDPLGGYAVTPQGYGQMVRLLKLITPKLCLVLEGGYNLETISKSMCECTKVLLNN